MLPSADPRIQWVEVLPKVPIGPTARHLFTIPETTCANYVKLNMYPDGGIVSSCLVPRRSTQLTSLQARFRVYGKVAPVFPNDVSQLFDLAHVFAGGLVEFTSDQHFGVGSNLILPGRGKDMGDGWETKRSRQPGHKDWVIIKLYVRPCRPCGPLIARLVALLRSWSKSRSTLRISRETSRRASSSML